jgi:hypothetical protein
MTEFLDSTIISCLATITDSYENNCYNWCGTVE